MPQHSRFYLPLKLIFQILHLGIQRNAADCTAVYHFLRSALCGNCAGCFSVCCDCFCTEPWRIQCRNFPFCHPGCTPGTDRSRVHDRFELSTDHVTCCNAPGISDCIPAIIQFPDRINQGYLPCFQHYSSGTFYHRTADRGQNL